MGKIKYEVVTVRVPKTIMDFLRGMEKAYGVTTEETIVNDLVACVECELEDTNGEEPIKMWKLDPVFKEFHNGKVRFNSTIH